MDTRLLWMYRYVYANTYTQDNFKYQMLEHFLVEYHKTGTGVILELMKFWRWSNIDWVYFDTCNQLIIH